MGRIYLHVPFSEKDTVKIKGAHWDKENKLWYVPDGLDSLPFIPWIPELADHEKFFVYSEYYFIAKNQRLCWKCEKIINLYAFFLPRGHKIMHDIYVDVDEWNDVPINQWQWDDYYKGMLSYDGDGVAVVWAKSPCLAPVSRITDLSPSALRNIQTFSGTYHAGFSKTAQSSYYANHCPYCNRLQGDFMIYEEPGGAFCPVTEKHASGICLHKINEAAFFRGGTTLTTNDLAEYMTIISSD